MLKRMLNKINRIIKVRDSYGTQIHKPLPNSASPACQRTCSADREVNDISPACCKCLCLRLYMPILSSDALNGVLRP